MKKSEQTRQFIIEKTAPVFNMNGYAGTSLAALEAATGLTKGALYGNFSDKEEIAREAFKYSVACVKSHFTKQIPAKASNKEKLFAFFSSYARYVFDPPIQGGCPILNTATEADDLNPVMKDAVAQEIDSIVTYIARLIELGKHKGEFMKDAKARELAYVFFTGIEGAIMISRVSGSDAAMKAVVKNIKQTIDQISL